MHKETERILGERLPRVLARAPGELEAARLESAKTGMPLRRALVNLGFAPETRVTALRAELPGPKRTADPLAWAGDS